MDKTFELPFLDRRFRERCVLLIMMTVRYANIVFGFADVVGELDVCKRTYSLITIPCICKTISVEVKFIILRFKRKLKSAMFSIE